MMRSGKILFGCRRSLFHQRGHDVKSENVIDHFTCCCSCQKAISRHRSSLSGPVRNGLAVQWSPKNVRKTFLDYFIQHHNHVFVPSSSVIPHTDSTILYTNSGMNQFKPVFLGQVDPTSQLGSLRRVANFQKCVRVGGKHNDFDDVGKDGYHHTFFEMLGNWSFGDYFKKEACKMALDLLTGSYGLSTKNLYVTYFGGNSELGLPPDLECRDIWIELGMPTDHILPFGMKDNFWDMGDSGPCGPCSEIHYSHLGGNSTAQSLVNVGSPQVIEIWNLVFMQFNRTLKGKLEALPKRHVDTGMGFERLVAVLQGSASNYDTELFQPLFSAIEKEVHCPQYGRRYGTADTNATDAAYRTIADHVRMGTVCVSDGVLPSNIEAGHCLRKAIRRAIMVSSKLTSDQTIPRGLLSKLVPYVVESLGDAYPELDREMAKVITTISEEEDRFLLSLGKGLAHFDAVTRDMSKNDNTLSADLMVKLYTKFGIPEEMFHNLATSRGLVPEFEKFQQIITAEKDRNKEAYREHHCAANREAFDPSAIQVLRDIGVPPTDDVHKYDYHFDVTGQITIPRLSSEVVGLWDGKRFVDTLFPSTQRVALVTEATNFYALAGGQISDVGSIYVKSGHLQVNHVSIVSGYVLHHGTLLNDRISCGDSANLVVDQTHREGCARNHTATHLLNAALLHLLTETEQKSSHVSTDYLRFDFATKAGLTNEQLLKVQDFVQNIISEKYRVQRICMPFAEAQRLPQLRTVTGEVYPDTVSLIAVTGEASNGPVDFTATISLEACCGTHVQNTYAIREFVIVSQKPVGQTVRSLRALTGSQAIASLELGRRLSSDVQMLSAQVNEFEQMFKKVQSVDLGGIHRDLAGKRLIVLDSDISVITRHELDSKIEELQRSVAKMMRAQIRYEFGELVLQNHNPDCIVYLVKLAVHRQIVFAEIPKCLPKVPIMVFTVQDSYVHGRCTVPEGSIRPEFNAERWLRTSLVSVPTALVKPYHDNPAKDCLFSFGIDIVNLLPEILRIAAQAASIKSR